MSDRLKPSRLRDHAEYHAALRELEELFLCDPGSPAGYRFDQLVAMVDEFDCARDLVGFESLPQECLHTRLVEVAVGLHQRVRRLYGMHADPLSGLPTTDDPECDLAHEATIRR
jgi:hypothetical protein